MTEIIVAILESATGTDSIDFDTRDQHSTFVDDEIVLISADAVYCLK